jgi:hypothetical protein
VHVARVALEPHARDAHLFRRNRKRSSLGSDRDYETAFCAQVKPATPCVM